MTQTAFPSKEPTRLVGGDYVITYSHIHPNTALRDLPTGYLAFLYKEKEAGGLNADLRAALDEYLKQDPSAVTEKLERGQRVPQRVVVKGFKPKATTG